MDHGQRFVRPSDRIELTGLGVVALAAALWATGCSFDSSVSTGTESATCPGGAVSDDGNRVCRDGSRVAADAASGADAGDAAPSDPDRDAGDTGGPGGDPPLDGAEGEADGDTGGGTERDTASDGCTVKTWYLDDDGDGFGTTEETTEACEQPSNYVADDGDCDDGDNSVNPDASEECNGIDDNCDGTTDEGCSCTYDPTEMAEVDSDDSHSGGVCPGQTIQQSDGTCSEPSNFEKQMPGESSCDDVDNDCDGKTDEDVEQSCYSGTSGTAGNGICEEGTRKCSAGSFESCTNETIQRSAPATSEVACSNGDDDDCDGNVDDCFFRDTIGGNPSVRINDLAVDSANDDIYVVGTDADFSSSGSSSKAVVAKYDPSGNRQWVERLSGDGVLGVGIALDQGEGQLFITGRTASALPNTNAVGGIDAYIARYDLSGNRGEIDVFGTGDTDFAKDIAFDPDDEGVVVGGATTGDYEGSNAGRLDAFVAEFDAESLNQEWANQYGRGSSENAEAVDIDASNGDVYVGGDTLGAIASGATNQGSGDIYVARYDSDGNRQWITQSGSSGDDDVRGVSVEDGTGVYVVGETEGDLESITNSGDDDAFVLKWNSNDSLEWFEGVSTGSHDDYDSVRYDPDSGNVFAVGSSAGTPGSVSIAGRFDVLVASYTASGSRNWIELRGTAEGDDGRAVGTSSNSSLLAIGGLWNWSSSSGDGFVSRIQ